MLKTMTVIDGTWYIKITGDYAGRIHGAVYDISDETNPVPITLNVGGFQYTAVLPTSRIEHWGKKTGHLYEWAQSHFIESSLQHILHTNDSNGSPAEPCLS